MLFFLFLFENALKTNICEKKCSSLFGDSQSKLSMCLDICSSRDIAQRERNDMKNDPASCLLNCSRQAQGSKDFDKWKTCRKSCFPESNRRSQNVEIGICQSDCEKYWKDTGNFGPCMKQCQNADSNQIKKTSHKGTI